MADQSSEALQGLEPDAEAAAERHVLSSVPPRPLPAWSKLRAAEAWLRSARLACRDAPPEAAKAAEWLLDNDFQIARAIRQISQDLPQSYYVRLPALAAPSEDEGLPRVFALAHSFLGSSRLQVSLAGAVRFLEIYQRHVPLTIGELWAFPTMLRIACLEVLVATLTPLLGEGLDLPFAPSHWARGKHSLEDTERIARAIANLGEIAAIPWDEFFDRTSHVERVLRSDPTGFYSRMDFESRDGYRRSVEALAAGASANEVDVAAL